MVTYGMLVDILGQNLRVASAQGEEKSQDQQAD